MRYEFTTTVWQQVSLMDMALVEEAYTRLIDQAVDRLRQDGMDDKNISTVRTSDCRYIGQGYELRVPVPDGSIDRNWLEEVVERFQAAHERTYFTRFEGTDVQIINLHVTGIGHVPRLGIQPIERGGADASGALKFERPVLFPGQGGAAASVPARFYDRDALKAGNFIEGPAIVEQFDSTTVIGPNQVASVDAVGHLVIRGVAA
jgi:N-methylhydantoinase A/oxoprolinase/acetone carboxylase beta subunit